MENLFRDSRVKITRALRLIDEVDAGLQAYDASNPISARFNPKGHLEIHWKEIPPEVLSTLGDAIHNMRTSLDLMATELARLNGKSDKDVYFPFAASKDEFPKQIEKKNFERAGDDAVALLKQFEPYTGGNTKLRAIHDLDIKDKHIKILVTRRDTKELQLSYKLDGGPISVCGSNSHKFLEGPLAGQPLIVTCPP